MNLTDLYALTTTLTAPLIHLHWTDNPATGRKDWCLQVSTCADFDRLAAQIPTPKDRRWLSGDRTSLGLAERHHAGEGGMLYHLCTGSCEACGQEHPGAECAQDDLFGGVACADREQNPNLDRLAHQLKAAIPERQETDDER